MADPTLSTKPSGGRRQKRQRTRNGCLNCRRRRKKCDETHPQCIACVYNEEACQWGSRISFRPENARTVQPSEHRNERQSLEKVQNYQILDVTEQIKQHYLQPQEDDSQNFDSINVAMGAERATNEDPEDAEELEMFAFRNRTITSPTRDAQIIAETQTRPPHIASHLEDLPEADIVDDEARNDVDISFPTISMIGSSTDTHPNGFLQHGRSVSISSPSQESAGTHISACDNATTTTVTDQSGSLPLSYRVTFGDSPEYMHDDGVFLPGSAYQELHKTLRHHVFNTARSIPQTRRGSAEPEHPNVAERLNSTLSAIPQTHSHAKQQSEGVDCPETLEVDQAYERLLWKNWFDEIAAWLDKFDRHQHFRYTLPSMSKKHAHLRFAILALSARQLESQNTSITPMSLLLYQEAIHLLLPRLQSTDVAVIASCIVLCVLEMYSCSPKAWRRHLDGCAALIQSSGTRGDSGGVKQALFWCFARMDVCGGLISSERTLVSADRWWNFSPIIENALSPYGPGVPFEEHANYSLYLLACVLDLFASVGMSIETGAPAGFAFAQTRYASAWLDLFERIELWYQNRPEEMVAVLEQECDDSDPSNPFPTLVFSSGAAISGNQLHHTAALLMLQNRPREMKRKTRSILWHAQRICGISISNAHHGCWTNSVQPLWIAGRTMSHPNQHSAIIKIYERIERETGWGATWRAQDLKEYWGT